MTSEDTSQVPDAVPNDGCNIQYIELPPIYDKNFVLTRANSAKSKQWYRKELKGQEFLDLFSEHREAAKKDGDCFVPGEIAGGERKATAVSTIYAAVYDIDAGQTYDEAAPHGLTSTLSARTNRDR